MALSDNADKFRKLIGALTEEEKWEEYIRDIDPWYDDFLNEQEEYAVYMCEEEYLYEVYEARMEEEIECYLKKRKKQRRH